MKFCERHWSALRTAIDVRGLTPYVAKGGADAAGRMRSETGDKLTADNFEPLMGAHNAILRHALDAAGLTIMAPNEDGSDRCPICYLTTEHAKTCTDPACPSDGFEK